MNLTNYLRENSPLHKDRESLTLAAIKELGITRKAVTKKLHAIAATSKSTGQVLMNLKKTLRLLGRTVLQEKYYSIVKVKVNVPI